MNYISRKITYLTTETILLILLLIITYHIWDERSIEKTSNIAYAYSTNNYTKDKNYRLEINEKGTKPYIIKLKGRNIYIP